MKGGYNVKRCGFSLVELLVVIAIILVLIAFLVPIFVAIEDRAYLSTCQSNMRQLGYAFKLYGTDQSGMLPLSDASAGGLLTGRSRVWEEEIYHYFDAKDIRDPEFLELVYCPSKGDYYRWKGFYYN